MSDSVPSGLTAAHLMHAVLPDEPGLAADAPPEAALALRRAVLGRSLARLDAVAPLHEALRDRLARLPPLPPAPPPASPPNLQALVEAARRRLREGALREEAEELDRRRFVLRRVVDGLAP